MYKREIKHVTKIRNKRGDIMTNLTEKKNCKGIYHCIPTNQQT